MKLQLLAQILRLVGLLSLLAYPGVLVANAMQAAALTDATKRGDVAASGGALMSVFIGATTVYPLVFLFCRALADKASNETRALAWSAAPLAFLGALAGLFALLVISENR